MYNDDSPAEVELFFGEDAERFEQAVGQRTSLDFSPIRARYLKSFLAKGARGFLKNGGPIRTAVAITGTSVLPLVINDGASRDCYLVSPHVHYIAYMIEEAKKMRPLFVSVALRAALSAFGLAFRPLQFDRFISINNWLFTTSLTVEPSVDELRALKRALRQRFPGHALVFRGVDLRREGLARALVSNGFLMLVHRPVFEWSPEDYQQKRHTKNERHAVRRDLGLTTKKPYTARVSTTMSKEEASLVAAWYEHLYIIKHSRFNAHFTAEYFETVVSTGICSVHWLEEGARTIGFATACDDTRRLIAALIGYDQRMGDAYRALMGSELRRSLDEKRLLFLSTGVADFKSKRGARETMEYEAFDVGHLPPHRRLPWLTMKAFLDFAVRRVDTSTI